MRKKWTEEMVTVGKEMRIFDFCNCMHYRNGDEAKGGHSCIVLRCVLVKHLRFKK